MDQELQTEVLACASIRWQHFSAWKDATDVIFENFMLNQM